MDEKLINDFHQKVTDERLNNHHRYEQEIEKLYLEILSGMTLDYSEYRKYVPNLLSSLESNNSHSISYSISLFFELYQQLISTRGFKFFDLSIMDYNTDDNTLEKMKPIFEESYSKSNNQRLSEDNFDISSLSGEDKKSISALIIHKLQTDAKVLTWDKEMIDVTMMQFIFLRQILVSLNQTELFYHAVGLFIDRLTTSEYYQAGRDIVEEIILSSYKDNVPELGYFNAFRLYSNTKSIHASLLYANLSLICILKKEEPYSEKFVLEVVWQGIKFFRNVKFYPWAVKIYNEVPTELNIRGYERRSLDHSYFTVLLHEIESSLPLKLLDYLNKEREEILSGGVNDALPWLLTLYNVRRLYAGANFSATGLGFYLNVFELIVPADTVKKYKDIIEADSEDLKMHLKESLVKLNETRNVEDFVYDNDNAIKISSRLIEYSMENSDSSAFLLSMILKSDYSILFKPKESDELIPLILPEINVEALNKLYEDKDTFLSSLPVNLNTSIVWLAYSEANLYQLELFRNDYLFNPSCIWDYKKYKELLNDDYFVNLSFSDTIKDRGGIRLVLPEEFSEEEKEISEKLNFTRIDINPFSNELYVVKDMEFSRFPHNLLLNKKGDFIGKNIPIVNVLSTEWLLQTKDVALLPKNYSKSIWIPVESGDIPLNYLNSNIEETLQEHSFEVFQQTSLQNPLSSDINIVCSHGAKNISETQIIFQENNPTYNLNSVIGKGKILIFFVCYSGSMKTEFFRNNVTSMVKRFIAEGYEAVIAPFWALDVTIPRSWLPEFLDSINAGLTISNAVFNANKKVYEQYPTPAAWACLHLYGNPNYKIKQE